MPHKDKRFHPAIADQARAIWGQYFQLRRKFLKLSVRELAAMAGVHRNAITGIESGADNYSINTFIAILGCLRYEVQLHEKDVDNDVPGMGALNPN